MQFVVYACKQALNNCTKQTYMHNACSQYTQQQQTKHKCEQATVFEHITLHILLERAVCLVFIVSFLSGILAGRREVVGVAYRGVRGFEAQARLALRRCCTHAN